MCNLRHHMMTSSNVNIFRVTGHLCGEFTGPGEFPTQRPVTRSFGVFFDLRLNKWLSKQPWGWWFETPSWSLWRQCNEFGLVVSKIFESSEFCYYDYSVSKCSDFCYLLLSKSSYTRYPSIIKIVEISIIFLCQNFQSSITFRCQNLQISVTRGCKNIQIFVTLPTNVKTLRFLIPLVIKKKLRFFISLVIKITIFLLHFFVKSLDFNNSSNECQTLQFFVPLCCQTRHVPVTSRWQNS